MKLITRAKLMQLPVGSILTRCEHDIDTSEVSHTFILGAVFPDTNTFFSVELNKPLNISELDAVYSPTVGDHVSSNLETTWRNAMCDDDTQYFWLWEEVDKRALRDRINETTPSSPTPVEVRLQEYTTKLDDEIKFLSTKLLGGWAQDKVHRRNVLMEVLEKLKEVLGEDTTVE